MTLDIDALRRDKRPQSAWVVHALIDRLEAAEKERDDVAQQLVQSEQGKRKISKECESYKAAYNDWADKTEWVQQGFNEGTISAKYFGLHRADVMARLLDEAEKERDALRAKIAEMERQEPVAWMSSRNGFICKENKNPEYNVPLKRFDLGAQIKYDCGEAGHDEGRCGNRQCLPGAQTQGEEK